MTRYFLKMCPRCGTGDMTLDWHDDQVCLACGHTIYAELPPMEPLPFCELPNEENERRHTDGVVRRAERAAEIRRIMRVDGCGITRAAAILGISQGWASTILRKAEGGK